MSMDEPSVKEIGIDKMNIYLAGTEVTFALLFGSYSAGHNF